MQKHPAVQASPVLLQEQFCRQPDILHLHFISLRRLTGVCAFVIVSGTRSSSSFVCPWPSSDPRSCVASRAQLQTLCSLIASDGEVHNQSLVEAFHVSAYYCRTRDKIIHLQCLSFWLSCISWKHRLHFCQVCSEQLTGKCTGLTSVENVAFMLKNDLKWKFNYQQWN